MVVVAPFPTPEVSRQTIEAIISGIGRDVTFYTVESLSGCDLCSLDPISQTSTDSYCPQCSGEYWIPTYSGTTVIAKVTWGKSEEKGWVTGGQLDDGDCMVQTMHTIPLENIIYSSKYAIVDRRELTVGKVILRGVPVINRILVVLREKEKE